ncbi:hypothetical protein [Paenibacillus agricola]|nr:hypothetical protein [Paenibacillus agricola]
MAKATYGTRTSGMMNIECYHEGNINHSWGNITGEEMICRFW